MENKMNSQTSLHQSDNTTPCSNGCGFFGTTATMNMCSKCYRDHRLKEEQAATAIAAVGRSITSTMLSTPVVTEESRESCFIKSKEIAVEAMAEVAVVKKAANRCGCCNKKVGVVGFKCRCGVTFCGSHRYPEEHNCSFDYKSTGRDAIAKANPLVVADKVLRF